MNRVFIRVVRSLVVLSGVILLTTLSIDATDYFQRSESALGAVVASLFENTCGVGTVPLVLGSGSTLCLDAYEASAGEGCLVQVPRSAVETANNINDPDCQVVSRADQVPWTQVLSVQAEQLCARAGKRLPTATEWYWGARGTPDNADVCQLNGAQRRTGADAQCRSGSGAYDMVGNVWEWVGDRVEQGVIDNVSLAASGYVADVSTDGYPVSVTTTPQAVFNNDYVWTEPTGVRSIMRGGYHGSGDEGGVYAFHAATAPQFSSGSIGFRCISLLGS